MVCFPYKGTYTKLIESVTIGCNDDGVGKIRDSWKESLFTTIRRKSFEEMVLCGVDERLDAKRLIILKSKWFGITFYPYRLETILKYFSYLLLFPKYKRKRLRSLKCFHENVKWRTSTGNALCYVYDTSVLVSCLLR